MNKPRYIVEPLIGHKVRITFRDGRKLTTVIDSCGDSGLTILSGIGGMIRFLYSDIDDIKDLESMSAPQTERDDYPVVPFRPDPRLAQQHPEESWWSTFPGALTIIAASVVLVAGLMLVFGVDGGGCQ